MPANDILKTDSKMCMKMQKTELLKLLKKYKVGLLNLELQNL